MTVVVIGVVLGSFLFFGGLAAIILYCVRKRSRITQQDADDFLEENSSQKRDVKEFHVDTVLTFQPQR